jgi:NarL family two-component system sensor histidine kinase LiaS
MLRRFRGLRWKLTLSYTVVTVATLLVVEIVILVGIGAIILHSNFLPGLLTYAVETFISPQVADYLDHPRPDVVSLTNLLEMASGEGLTFQSSQNPKIIFKLGDFEEDTALTILDRDLVPLASIPESVDRASYDDAGDLLDAALRGEDDIDKISRISNGFLTLAVPVTREDGDVLGVVLMIMPFPPRDALTQALSLIGGSLILFTIIVGIIGTIFGYITARGLTKRLNAVSEAAGSWSRGDFSTYIRDRSGDEIGTLSQQLNRMAEQLQNLLHAKEELATLEERNRLARDLHDGVKQQVFATTMQVGAARVTLDMDLGTTREHLNEAERLARQAQAELDAILRELRPIGLQAKGLIQALRDHIDDWSRSNHIVAELDVQGEGDLPLDIEQALFRVAQEALSNIARHSQAGHVEIHLEVDRDAISISIHDDGTGFDINEAEGKGVGLRSMRERVEALGGSLRVESIPKEGTKVVARIPLPEGASS